MRKLTGLAAMALLLTQPAFADHHMSDMAMEHANADHAAMMQEEKTVTTTGTVRVLQKDAIVIKHPAIEALGWPAMTMSFKATAEQMEGLAKGDEVEMTFTAKGMDATLVDIEKQ